MLFREFPFCHYLPYLAFILASCSLLLANTAVVVPRVSFFGALRDFELELELELLLELDFDEFDLLLELDLRLLGLTSLLAGAFSFSNGLLLLNRASSAVTLCCRVVSANPLPVEVNRLSSIVGVFIGC